MSSLRKLLLVLLLITAPTLVESPSAQRGQREWPAITAETKPWTRWWWQGSAVDRASLTAQLEAMAARGLGGVEVTPIYGVRGVDARFIQYLSPQWMAMLDHTLREATRLKLRVDMATGTGWPFGGPWVSDETAPRSLSYKTWTLSTGERLTERIMLRQAPLVRAIGNQVHVVNEGAPGDPPRGSASSAPVIKPNVRPLEINDLVEPVAANRNLQALALEQVKYPRDLPLTVLMAYSDGGDAVDLTSRVQKDGTLDWTAPQGRWTLYALFSGWHGKLVERAAPGGEGNVIDHFSTDAIKKYLLPFDRAFAGKNLNGLRAFFNDSYEVDDATGEADWTPLFLTEFEKRRGYDLRRYLPALLGPDAGDVSARVRADYRETISDLLLDTFTTEWSAWAKQHGQQVRNQAHGSPASLLDLYAASDIPETEGAEIQRFKWATSAAHVAGRRLVGAEAATWLGEHFRVRLADVRAAVDRFFVSGVNHIVYHGTAYSPPGDPWPGWQFYASVEFNPQNAWWDDFSALNAYMARVQSFLQSGRPDNDVLLYYPFYESLTVRGKSRLAHFGGAAPPAQGTSFEKAAETLQARGFTYDFISDRQVRRLKIAGDRLTSEGGSSYRTIVLPASSYVSLDTVQQIIELARSGAIVVSLERWPSDVSGLADLETRRARLKAAIDAVTFGPADANGIREAVVGRGRIVQGPDLERLLARVTVRREPMVDRGLQFARRVDDMGRIYFVSNPGDKAIDAWVPIDSQAETVMGFDAMTGRHGRLMARPTGSPRQVYLQLPPGGSLIVAESPAPVRQAIDVYLAAGNTIDIPGPWTVRFLKGGPRLPQRRTTDKLVSWTTFGNDAEAFSGTASYVTTFPRPKAGAWQLDLGRVAESARIRINGREIATLIGPPYRVVLDSSQLPTTNTLEVWVTNLSANRIRDLDRRGVGWKKFYNVNFPARSPENRGADGLFTAARWEPLESGLLGPVTLTPVTLMRTEQTVSAPVRNADERAAAPPLVDHHQHLFGPTAVELAPTIQPVDAEKLIALLDAAGITRAVVLSLAYQLGNPNRPPVENEYARVKAENDWTAQQVARYPDRLRGFCSINPLKDYALEEIERCSKDPQLRYGLKMHFGNSDVLLDNPDHLSRLRAVFSAANRHRMAIVVHMRPSVTRKREYGPSYARAFLEELMPMAPDVPVQVAHLAGAGSYAAGPIDEALGMLAAALSKRDPRVKNLYIDVSGVAGLGNWRTHAPLIARRIREIGVDRILYGSDGAGGANPAPKEAWAFFRELPLTEEEFRTIANNVAPYLR